MSNIDQELKLQLWKQQKRLKTLQDMRGNGTSLISLIIPPKGQVAKVVQMLHREYSTANNIKDRVNRLSVLSAITSTKEKLKLYNNRVPDNGLAVYCGSIIRADGKERKVNLDIEPSRPVIHSLYRCDNKFHVQPLLDVLQIEDKFGFVIMDGNGCLFGTLHGNNKEILYNFSVNLPKKHGRGGQSAVRFGRLRMEKRHAYLKKITELIVKFFIKNDKVFVKGFIFAGSAEFKNKLVGADFLDQRIKKKILKVVDISYGGERGFQQAIELSMGCLGDIRFVEEKQLIQSFFKHIAKNTGMITFGVKETIHCMEIGAVQTLIIWENIDLFRIKMRNPLTKDERILYLKKSTIENDKQFLKDGIEYEVVEKEVLIDWLIDNYSQYGIVLEIISDKTPDGTQFCQGFGGIGGILRYQVDIYNELNDDNNDDDDFYNNIESDDENFEDEFNEYDDFM